MYMEETQRTDLLFQSLFKIEFSFFMHSWLPCIFIAIHGVSLVAVSGGKSLAVVCRLFIAVASLFCGV